MTVGLRQPRQRTAFLAALRKPWYSSILYPELQGKNDFFCKKCAGHFKNRMSKTTVNDLLTFICRLCFPPPCARVFDNRPCLPMCTAMHQG